MNKIELRAANVSQEYIEKWNAKHYSDMVHIYKNGEKVSDQLYRIGGIGVRLNQPYFILNKMVECYYEDHITLVKKDKPHLQHCACIIDNEGCEKVVVEQFSYLSLLGGVIYGKSRSASGEYVIANIKTKQIYCRGYSGHTLSSDEFLFVEDRYNDNKEQRGVLQINKETGEVILHKSTK